jgi:tagatose 1,6-diphosphate aldolase
MAETPSFLPVTTLFGLNLSPGKIRGLQRITNPNGTLTMVATDQNSAMIGLMKKSRPAGAAEPSYDEIIEAKIDLTQALGPHCSALLIDALYGALNVIASQSIPAHTGLLIRIEKSGAKFESGPAKGLPMAVYEPGLSVAKIKRFGADAVKLLAPYEPGQRDSAEHQFAFTQEIYEECRKHDILMLLEPVAIEYQKNDKGEKETKKSPSYTSRKAQTVIESARHLSRYCDIYKAEFPGTLGVENDRQLEENLKALSAACARPWVLLSAGVDYSDYKKQVEMAMANGASGVLGGRAFWQEYFTHPTAAARAEFARGECVKRVKEIDSIVKAKAMSWHAKYGLTKDQLTRIRVAEGWHLRYGGDFGGVSGEASKFDPTSAY